MAILDNLTVAENASVLETTTNAVTTTVVTLLTGLNLTNYANESTGRFGNDSNLGASLQQPMLPEDDDIHKNPELKYFSTVIIIFIGLTILIVPAFCFVGMVCARTRVLTTVREVAGRGWGFRNAHVPYAEFGTSEEAFKPDNAPGPKGIALGASTDEQVLVDDDIIVPYNQDSRVGSFLRVQLDGDDDISSTPATFVQQPT